MPARGSIDEAGAAMIAPDIGRAILLLTVPAAYAFGGLTMIHFYVVAFLMGTLSVLFSSQRAPRAVFVRWVLVFIACFFEK
jgi:hypothetical protein